MITTENSRTNVRRGRKEFEKNGGPHTLLLKKLILVDILLVKLVIKYFIFTHSFLALDRRHRNWVFFGAAKGTKRSITLFHPRKSDQKKMVVGEG